MKRPTKLSPPKTALSLSAKKKALEGVLRRAPSAGETGVDARASALLAKRLREVADRIERKAAENAAAEARRKEAAAQDTAGTPPAKKPGKEVRREMKGTAETGAARNARRGAMSPPGQNLNRDARGWRASARPDAPRRPHAT